MLNNKLKKNLNKVLNTIQSNFSIHELNTPKGRQNLDELFGEVKPYYIAIVNPVRLSIYYFCPQACAYLSEDDFDYSTANLSLLLKVLAKENFGMIYQGVQHFMSKDRDKEIELNCKVKRYDNTWRDVYFISKLLHFEGEENGLVTLSIVVDVKDYLENEFKQQTKYIEDNYQLNNKQVLKVNKLSWREQEILILWIINEKTKEAIAEDLFISEHTVRAHRRSIINKLGTKSPFALTRYALFLSAKQPHLLDKKKLS